MTSKRMITGKIYFSGFLMVVLIVFLFSLCYFSPPTNWNFPHGYNSPKILPFPLLFVSKHSIFYSSQSNRLVTALLKKESSMVCSHSLSKSQSTSKRISMIKSLHIFLSLSMSSLSALKYPKKL